MKRIFQRKVKLASCRASGAQSQKQIGTQMIDVKGEQDEYAVYGMPSPSRTSATALGLALSVVASGFVFQQHDNRAVAAESPVPTSSISNSQSAQGLEPENLDSLRVLQSVSVTQTPRSAAIKVDPQPLKHVVREGDTLWSIAQDYGVSPRKLALLNGLPEDETLRIGQALDIPVDAQAPAELPTSPQRVNASEPPSQPERNLAHLQIQRLAAAVAPDNTVSDDGSSAGQLSSSATPQSGVGQSDASADARSNTSQVVSNLRVSRERLRSTLSGIRASSSPIPSFQVSSENVNVPEKLARVMAPEAGQLNDWPTPPPTAGDEVVVPTRLSEPQMVAYRLQPGDTLAAIANRYNIPLRAIVDANSIANPNRVFAGQTIQIPVASSQPDVAARQPVSQAESRNAPMAAQSNAEALLSALPQRRFSTTDSLPFASAPVVPLPMSVAEPNGADLDGADAGAENAVESVLNAEDISADVPVDSLATDDSSVAALADERFDSSDATSPAAVDASEGVSESVESGTEANLPVEAPERSSGIYVENLLNEIEELASSTPSETEQRLLNQINQVTSQDEAVRVSYRPDQSYIQRQDAINPEFRAEPIEASAQDNGQVDDLSSADPLEPGTNSSEQLVAAAPLGSENYRPLSQPVTGRMVSPELPPLPGFENYIPNGEATFNGYLWPARGVFTSGYGWRWGRMHRGIDIAAPVGTPIYAAAPGVIEFSGWNSGGYGNMVDIRHPDGSKTRYAHNSRNLVRVGQRVTQGQQIAEMGSTGYSTGPHVHFEIHRPDSGTVNPIAYLPDR